ncbi:hypothetical protein PIB19_14960 [Sphingomonas sp. 7/4-4]|uniref:hypothetical protein n=1 Tax=Sphingomonas sp. 7/4-4 TaxID=3018446 RepID=UPI0022F401E6|nr:hypothetical protein [Sphingomonas sp. 7/4-4]WBY06805.1 hypothetical protein PIB19_14960 [Sphingomonas sp. 7/4-4]
MIANEEVISLLQGKDTLRDASLVRVEIASSLGVPAILLEFEARAGSTFSRVMIHFDGIIEFSMDFCEGNAFLDIWDLKLLKLDDGSFYLSLDPDAATLPAAGQIVVEPSDTDGFFVRARRIEARVA